MRKTSFVLAALDGKIYTLIKNVLKAWQGLIERHYNFKMIVWLWTRTGIIMKNFAVFIRMAY